MVKLVAFAVALVLAVAALAWVTRPPPALPAPVTVTAAAPPARTPPPAPVPAPPPAASMAEQLSNPLERSADLRTIFTRFRDSGVRNEKHIAYRAWSACFPTFIGPAGQVASLDSVTAGVDRNGPASAQRIEAYRALMGRCKGFADIARAELLAETARQRSAFDNGSALSPGELAARRLAEGDAAGALQMARAALTSGDPGALDSLREFVNLYLVRQVDAGRAAPDERPDLRALAYAMAACRLGLECGAGSLTALQQCASSGACSGSVAERYEQSVAEPDRARLAQETERVLRAAAGGGTAGLGW